MQRDLEDELRNEFPGLVDGETEVNGADLVDWLTEWFAVDDKE